MANLDRKSKVAMLSICSNTTLIIFKVLAGILSGSVSIISEAIHSGMDLVASLVAFFAVRQSSKPADIEHPYGHGKVENLSGLVEGVLILVAAAMIITEAIKKLTEPQPIEQAYVAILVMVSAGIVNYCVSRKLYKVSKEEDSMALEADALHLKTDVYTSLGVGAGILLIKFTNISILDPIIAMLVALLIIKESWELLKRAISHLIDVKLPAEIEEEIGKIILEHKSEIIDYHKLKTRQSGNVKHIDFHITVPPQLSVQEAHDIVGNLKQEINHKFQNTRVNIHVDPYKNNKNDEL
jgi:cation diffusion facilitator family transporter